ncbi:4440_t:CDS:10 [Ambispora leptoticha]|uniref:4440_t:CDS:1 n=1 Tax=Ambispora leptoticha TaxID=144679 RepID=A0A9N8Z119_9GLOM|nr:4440_t:CDS:10 [Ambispora leptoticha]
MFSSQNIKSGIKRGHILSYSNVLLHLEQKTFRKGLSTNSNFKSQNLVFRASRPVFSRSVLRIPKRHETSGAAPINSLPVGNKKTAKFRLLTVVGTSLVGSVILLILDYRRNLVEAEKHEIKELISCGPTGGPKNLPIAQHLTDEKDFEADKPRLLILGSGWGAVSVLKELEKDQYYVTVVSPQSLLEPIRSILKRIHGHFIEAKAIDVDFENNLVEVKRSDAPDKCFYVPYDKLIIAVGSQSITHGIEGIEHCHFLKTINDARKLRRTIMNNFEKASLPSTTPEERKRLLSFVVCGGGVEFAGELYDFLTEDLFRYVSCDFSSKLVLVSNMTLLTLIQFPIVLRKEVRVSIIQSQDHILNTYDERISKFVEKKFSRDKINLITNARVSKIKEDCVVYKYQKTGEEKELPYGLVLWSTGIAMNPLTRMISEKIPEQKNTRALVTDARLRLKGVPNSTVYALGDCATIENPNLVKQLVQFFIDADEDESGYLDYKEFKALALKIANRYPITYSHLKKASELFRKYDKDKNDELDLQELKEMFQDIDKKLTSLPATAQVAHQQGKYLGKKLNKLALAEKTKIIQTNKADVDHKNLSLDLDDAYPPFHYAHLGSLAYIGNAAVADFGMGWTWMGGLTAVYLWKSVYLSEQVSFRTRALLALDWTKVEFIKQEAKEKAREIQLKADEEFNIEKAKLVRQESINIEATFQRKIKQAEVEKKIEQSNLINKSRLRVLQERQQKLENLFTDSRAALKDISEDKTSYQDLLKNLILEGLFRLMDENVNIVARKSDIDLINAAIKDASNDYTNQSKLPINIQVDSKEHLPDSRINNTLEERLSLAQEELLPEIRILLFGHSPNRKFFN